MPKTQQQIQTRRTALRNAAKGRRANLRLLHRTVLKSYREFTSVVERRAAAKLRKTNRRLERRSMVRERTKELQTTQLLSAAKARHYARVEYDGLKKMEREEA